MGLITTEVEVGICARYIKYYEALGYELPKHYDKNNKLRYTKGAKIKVRVEDLPKCSHAIVNFPCDICGVVLQDTYQSYNRRIKKDGSCVCLTCSQPKKIITMIKNFGSLENAYKHGNEQRILTCREKYGADDIMHVPEIKKHMINRIRELYGVDNVGMNEDIKRKIRISQFKNGTAPSSIQQNYLHKLYGGELNYPINLCSVDICWPNEKLVLEYSGGGHRLSVIHGNFTEEEFEHRERKRFYTIRKEGYKQIFIISRKDYLPSDTTLLQMLQYARDFFTQNPDRSWLSFDLDNNCIYNAYHKETDIDDILFYDFGKLRKIDNIENIEFAEPVTVNINSYQAID